MDDELDLFEAELRGLKPREPSPELRRRIQNELAPTRRRAAAYWAAAIALPIAAGLAVLIATASRTPSHPHAPSALAHSPAAVAPATSAASAKLKPVSAENILYAADTRTVVLDDGTPARRERLQFVDTITWSDPHSHASLTWTVPREEVRVVPIRYE